MASTAFKSSREHGNNGIVVIHVLTLNLAGRRARVWCLENDMKSYMYDRNIAVASSSEEQFNLSRSLVLPFAFAPSPPLSRLNMIQLPGSNQKPTQ
jgi:hypothetical protein